MEPNLLSFLIGTRIQSARKSAGLTQAELSEKLKFKDRQILSNIESGTRKTSADELVKLMRLLGKPLDYFTDPYLLTDPDAFHWRAGPHDDPADFESKAGKLASGYLRFSDLLGESINPVVSHLSLTPHPSFEEIEEKTKVLTTTHSLGAYPAEKIIKLIEELNFQILLLDPPDSKGAGAALSSASCHLSRMNFIFLNRHVPQAGRNIELAHQLFHLLTWHLLKPDSTDRFTSSTDPNDISYLPYEYGHAGNRPRIERLADHFAAALLMPEKSVQTLWKARTASSKLKSFIIESSALFQVPAPALKSRLKTLDLISPTEAASLSDENLKTPQMKETPPKLFSPKFVTLLHSVLEKGHVSHAKAAELLNITGDGLKSLLRSHDFKP